MSPGNPADISDTLRALSKAVATSLGKSEQLVMVSLTTDKPMCFAGTEAACAYGELMSIGAVGGAKNKEISAAIAAVMSAKLRVDPSRFYFKIVDVDRSNFGWNGGTF
eukprot:GHRR01004116.1.p1 GENE.GHRR01004116.1~~GHRR01004116.1.p1  ORF type:complete len:108 (+),score=20.79 GHRR01004116.1:229-552(+)